MQTSGGSSDGLSGANAGNENASENLNDITNQSNTNGFVPSSPSLSNVNSGQSNNQQSQRLLNSPSQIQHQQQHPPPTQAPHNHQQHPHQHQQHHHQHHQQHLANLNQAHHHHHHQMTSGPHHPPAPHSGSYHQRPPYHHHPHQPSHQPHPHHTHHQPPPPLPPHQQTPPPPPPLPHYHHQKFNHPRGDNESNVNHVLLITVMNPHYPITCDLIHQICSTYGKVNRIVIFKKNGVQAMVEFDNVDSAKRAKSMLYGCDIYSGCCTLKIEFAKPTRLNIHKNDNESFDYTNPNLSAGQDASGQNPNDNPQGATSDHSSHHQGHGNQSRGGTTGGLRGGGASGGQGGHYQTIHHGPQTSDQHHPSQGGPHQPSSAGHHGGQPYGMTGPINHQADASADNFQDSNFGHHRGGSYSNVDSYGGHGDGPQGGYPRQDGHQSQQHHHHHHHHHSHRQPLSSGSNQGSSFPAANALMAGPTGLPPPQGTVMMVYGLQPDRVSCDRLFNLFCLYGNVVKVKFLRTKEGCAMVQMGDVLAVERCVNSLNKTTLFGNELQISYSKQAFLHDVMQPFILPDGSPSFKDFMSNKNNRFKNPEVASKNRILPPSQVLHFFNAPQGIAEDDLIQLFKQTSGHDPVTIKIFTPRNDNSKSYSGLVTFKDAAEATEALVTCNHMSMPKAGAPHPYILRLCFSPPSSVRSQHHQQMQSQQPQQQASQPLSSQQQ